MNKLIGSINSVNLSEIHPYSNLYRLYFTHYKKMCNLCTSKHNEKYDYKKVVGLLSKFKYKKYVQQFSVNNIDRTDFYFFKKKKILLILNVNNDLCTFTICYDKYPKKIINNINLLKVDADKNKIGLIVEGFNSLNVKSLELDICNFDRDNYNNDLCELHDSIIEKLNGNKSGIHLLYGLPGTGKSSYISSLTSCVNKKFIYIPNSFISVLDTPKFLDLLYSNLNSIFVIEDAEKYLLDREKNSNSPISALLNLSDGILGQTLKCQFICTFNTNIDNVDKALLREGRLITSYEFKELTDDKIKALCLKLNVPYDDNIKVLSSIYGNKIIKNGTINKQRTKVGFKTKDY